MENPRMYEETNSGLGYLNFLRKRKKLILCWRVTVSSVLLITTMGLISMLVGFLVPKKKDMVSVQNDIVIIYKADGDYNQNLDICKIVGIVLVFTGGIMMSGVFLTLMMMRKHRMEITCTEDTPLALSENNVETESMDIKEPVMLKISPQCNQK